ncbi:hypothetical protein ACFX2B_029944 [Malus domestica]
MVVEMRDTPPPPSESILQGSSVGPDRFLSIYNQNKDRQYKASKTSSMLPPMTLKWLLLIAATMRFDSTRHDGRYHTFIIAYSNMQ